MTHEEVFLEGYKLQDYRTVEPLYAFRDFRNWEELLGSSESTIASLNNVDSCVTFSKSL